MLAIGFTQQTGKSTVKSSKTEGHASDFTRRYVKPDAAPGTATADITGSEIPSGSAD